MRNFIASITLVAFITTTCFLPNVAYAQDPPTDPPTTESAESESSDQPTQPPERVATLTLGQPAPFAGTLFSTTAAARLLADLELTQAACDLQTTRRLQLQESEYRLQLDLKQAQFDALQLRHTELMTVRDQQVDYLTQNYRPQKWYESGEFWFATGVVGGILITIAAGYAIGQVN